MALCLLSAVTPRLWLPYFCNSRLILRCRQAPVRGVTGFILTWPHAHACVAAFFGQSATTSQFSSKSGVQFDDDNSIKIAYKAFLGCKFRAVSSVG